MDDPLPEHTVILIKILFTAVSFILLFVFSVFKNAIFNYDFSVVEDKIDKTKADFRVLKIGKYEQRYVAAYEFLCGIINFACVFLVLYLLNDPLEYRFSLVLGQTVLARTLSFISILLIYIVFYYLFCVDLSRKISFVFKDKIISFSSFLTIVIGLIFLPFTYLFDKVSVFVLRILGVKFNKSFESPTESEIRQLVDEAEEIGELEETQREMINNVFDFDDKSVANVMTHRTDVVAIENTDDINELVKQAISEGFSRIPVFIEDLDNIIGIIHVKDLLPFVGKKIPSDISVKSILRDVYFVPETKMCDDLFREMTEKKAQMAVVVDEYGGTAGIITLEDLIESVFGSIQDEYDLENIEIEQLSEKVFEIDGSTDIYQAEEELGIILPKGDYDTVGGLIISNLGVIPDINESVEIEGAILTVLDADDRKIDKIKVELSEKTDIAD